MKLTRTATTGLATLALISCGHGDRLTKSGLAEAETPAEVAAALGMGWNLGNQLDAWETAEDGRALLGDTLWHNPEIDRRLFTKLSEAGIKTVRIPTTWLDAVGPAPEYKIDSTWLNHVADIADMAHDAGLNAIINIHHDGADSQHWLSIKDAASDDSASQKNAQIENQLRAMWTQIGRRFKSYGQWLVFETMNEIHDGGWGWGANMSDDGRQYGILNEWQQVCVDAIRASGGENASRWIAVQGYVCNPDLTVKHMKLPTDSAKRTIVSVHFYDPYEYTLNAKYEQWGHKADSAKKESWGDEENIRKILGMLKKRFVDNGTPVYLGEIGCVNRDTDEGLSFRRYYLEYLCKAAKTHDICPMFWDNGYTGTGREQSALIDRRTMEFVYDGEEVLRLMVNAIENADSAYTLQSVYDK